MIDEQWLCGTYVVRGGAEAAVHAARLYILDLQQHPTDHEEHFVLKLDFQNAFNTLRRDKMLLAVQMFAPDLFPLAYSSYASSSLLFWGDQVIESAEGVQQGDPLGPLLFCLAIHPLVSQLESEFCVWYLDDGTIGGPSELLFEDLQSVVHEGAALGLFLNEQKCEVICINFWPPFCYFTYPRSSANSIRVCYFAGLFHWRYCLYF